LGQAFQACDPGERQHCGVPGIQIPAGAFFLYETFHKTIPDRSITLFKLFSEYL